MKAKHHKQEPSPEDQLYEEVKRPDRVQGGRQAASAGHGKVTNAKMISEPSSTLTHLVPQVEFRQSHRERQHELLRP